MLGSKRGRTMKKWGEREREEKAGRSKGGIGVKRERGRRN